MILFSCLLWYDTFMYDMQLRVSEVIVILWLHKMLVLRVLIGFGKLLKWKSSHWQGLRISGQDW